MRSKIKQAFFWGFVGLAVAGVLSSCDFDKLASIPIPQDPPQLLVECYLEDSMPPRLDLSMTQGYFDSVNIVPVYKADIVLIAPDGTEIPFEFDIYVDRERGKIYNWGAADIIRLHEGEVWKLRIQDSSGRVITAQSVVTKKIPIDSITYQMRDNDTLAYAAAWVKDVPNVVNYYRMIANVDSMNGQANSSFAFQDNFRDGQEFPMRTGYSLAWHDTVTVRVYSLEPAYYHFLNSVAQAQRNNGNPFAQPNRLKSTVSGGIGVFTTLVWDKRTFVVNQPKGKVF
jgi:hypothetical protein